MTHVKHKNPAADPQLVAYIIQNHRGGADDASIREALLQAGWPAYSVDQAFASFRHSHPTNRHHDAVDIPQKYGLFAAIADGFRAIKANIKGFLLASLVSLAISSGAFMAVLIIGLIGVAVLGLSLGGFDHMTAPAVVGIIILILLLFAVYYAAGTFMTASLAIAADDGAKARQSDIGAIVSRSFKVLPRLMLSQLLTGIVMLGPLLILIVLLMLIGLLAGDVSSDTNATNGVVDFMVGAAILIPCVAWTVFANMALALVSMVAIFEPHVAATKTLRRSWHLMKQGGFWFMAKAFLLICGIELPFVPFLVLSDRAEHTDTITAQDIIGGLVGMVFFILMIPAIALCLSTLVVFYRNRVAVRG